MSDRSDLAATAHQQPSRAERHVGAGEWLVAIVSALVVIASIGFVAYRAITSEDTPPKIRIAVERIVPTESGYVVELSVANHGGTTAKGLSIEGQLLSGGRPVMVRSTGFTYVPDGSVRRGGMFFPVDPRQYELRLYPVGFDYP